MFAGFGPLELIIVLVIVLLIFGPKRLPGLGRSVGGALREFKDSVTGHDEPAKGEGDRAELDPAADPAAPAPAPARENERDRTPQA